MNSKNIIVIGASAGGFEALKTLVRGLPAELRASVLIVWHISPEVRGVLPHVLNRIESLPAAHPDDREEIRDGHIYIAPPDRHMLVENGQIRITRGPKENRFRPAIDPLFRSAAYHYGATVIGVILSGSLDDGTSGLWTVKNRGGIAIVQDPNDAEVPSMPENAIREVAVDYTLPVAAIPTVLVDLLDERRKVARVTVKKNDENKDKQLKLEIGIALEETALDAGVMELGNLTPYTCPECHGVLSALTDGTITRFRCHTGHGFSVDSLLATLTENIEKSMWSAIRGVEESIILLNHIGDHFAELNQPQLAAAYFKKANEARARNDIIRAAVFSNEQLATDNVGNSGTELGRREQRAKQAVSAWGRESGISYEKENDVPAKVGDETEESAE